MNPVDHLLKENVRLNRRLTWADREVGSTLGELQEAHFTRQKLREALQALADAEADRRRDSLGDIWPEGIRRMVEQALALVKDNPEAGT
jgi:hypothetical protein